MPTSKASPIPCPDDIVCAYRRDPNNPLNRIYNGGWHPEGKRNFRKAVRTITECLKTYKRAALFHVCFERRTNDEHKALLHALIRKLDRAGIPCEWFSAREIDGSKGEHLHAFILVDRQERQPQEFLNTFDDSFLGREAAKRGIKAYVNRPQNSIHGGQRFASLPWLGSSRETTELAIKRMEDAMIWLTYIFKARGKPVHALLGQVFSASRPNRKRASNGVPVRGFAADTTANQVVLEAA